MGDLSSPIFTNEKAARQYLEKIRWPDGAYCPHCGESKKIKRLKGKSHRPGLYQCNACRGAFTVTVGTVYERSKVPLNKWLLATYLLCASKKGMSAHQLHRMIDVTYKTAWFMFHRIREAMMETFMFQRIHEAMEEPDPDRMNGKTDGVKTSLHEQEFSNHETWVPKAKTDDKDRVMVVIGRDGTARSFYAKDFRKQNHIPQKNRESATASSNDGYFAPFKRGMVGVYQHCGEKYLENYLHEFQFRHVHRKLSDTERTKIALGCGDIDRKKSASKPPRKRR